jgi:ATP-dependent DNA helicase RecQ
MDLLTPLQAHFGFAAFRPGQQQVVEAAVAGRDTLALMPTGSGKSLTYQLAAMLRPTPTLVLSPLIALMKDQIDKLPVSVATQATFVNSSLEPGEAATRLADAAAGRYRLLYAAPERLRQQDFVDALAGVGVGLVVIDEVHCVSMWGHDFRPDYLFIRHALEQLGNPAILGMTATATPDTEAEIATALGRDPAVVRASVARPNLRFDVERVAGEEDRLRSLVHRLQELDGGSAIVYARSRRSCERLARTLASYGMPITHYHAGLEPSERTRVQEGFVSGEIQGVVATTAFGMGIDKADVRLVALVNFPDSLESYVQMVGRAGRDGEPSDTVLYASRSDSVALKRFAVGDIPTAAELRAVYGMLRASQGPIAPEQLAAVLPKERDARVIVGMLEQAGLAERGFDAGRLLRIELTEAPEDAPERVAELLARYASEAGVRADRIVDFAARAMCRHAQVAEHFGERAEPGSCGACDICAPRTAVAMGSRPTTPLPADVSTAIVDAVRELRWPLGRRSLVAMLRGSVGAPPSARRARAFGLLAAATDAQVKRWVEVLVVAGALCEETTDDGFRVLVVGDTAELPRIGAPAVAAGDPGIAARLRAWRLERSRTDGVPAYVVLHDGTIDELAATRPTSSAELLGVRGFGPTKLERYGADVLAIVADAASR